MQWTQIKYQVWHQLQRFRPSTSGLKAPNHPPPSSIPLQLKPSIPSSISYLGNHDFQFLNLEQAFGDRIDWNFSGHGKLWTYNLNYFDYLNQPNLSPKEGLALIHDFIQQIANSKDGIEPFPTSLRMVNWIKFLRRFQLREELIDRSLWQQLIHLNANLEYRLMGNHLLENAVSLLFGAYYFEEKALIKKAEQLLESQLEEQILADGAHFELSPMYHQLMLFRVLDCINLLQENEGLKGVKILSLLKEKAVLMLGWMEQMAFSNGDLADVNDSAFGIAPMKDQLIDYADRLGLLPKKVPLKDCGYRKVHSGNYEVLVDIGQIGPDYIPGHAHSDTFNFILYHQSEPVIVDTGISTYEKNERRRLERSTQSHNTVMINGLEQSEVWGGFRVARRARVVDYKETANQICATHNGYQRINSLHQRCFTFFDQQIEIEDRIDSDQKASAFFHFHPKHTLELSQHTLSWHSGKIELFNPIAVRLEPYELAIGFNQTQSSLKLVVDFQRKLMSKIILS